MAHRRSSFRGRGGISESQRRKKTWLSFASVLTAETVGTELIIPPLVAAGGSTAVFGLPSANAAALGLLEGTIMRVRGSVEIPKSTVASNFFVVAFGMGFVTDEAFAAGAVPNPATPEGADWDGWMIYRSQLQGNLDANSGVLDSKAMRKWQSGMTFVQVAGLATNDAAGAASQTVQTILRGLFLLP